MEPMINFVKTFGRTVTDQPLYHQWKYQGYRQRNRFIGISIFHIRGLANLPPNSYFYIKQYIYFNKKDRMLSAPRPMGPEQSVMDSCYRAPPELDPQGSMQRNAYVLLRFSDCIPELVLR